MARLPYLNANDLAPPDRDLLDPPINLARILAYSPSGTRAFRGLGAWIRLKAHFDPRLREMAILRVGVVTRTDYEYSHHIQLGRLTGLERLVLTATDEATTGPGISAETFDALRRHLDEELLVELTIIVAFYNGVVRVLNTLDIDVEPDYEHYLEEFPLP